MACPPTPGDPARASQSSGAWRWSIYISQGDGGSRLRQAAERGGVSRNHVLAVVVSVALGREAFLAFFDPTIGVGVGLGVGWGLL